MASIASAEFKRIFGLKRGHEGHLKCRQKNNVFSAILELGVLEALDSLQLSSDWFKAAQKNMNKLKVFTLSGFLL